MSIARHPITQGGLESQPHWGESHHWTVPNLENTRVVVDLGRWGEAGQAAATFDPQIVILTHSDSDHIGGSNAFFASLQTCSPGTPRELWIPVEWHYLSTRECETAKMGSGSLLAPSKATIRAVSRMLGRDDCQAIRGAVDEVIPAHVIAGRLGSYSDDVEELLEKIKHKVNALRTLIADAESAGMSVRYFCVDAPAPTWRTEGRPGAVTFVNAEEVTPTPPRSSDTSLETVVVLYALTVQNRRALVTYLWGWEAGEASGALIWSDTDGSTCSLGDPSWIPWDRLMVMSAPHHGSANPVHARIWYWRTLYAPDLPVVLAGGLPGQKKPASDFLSVSRRGCTMCRRARPGSTLVSVDLVSQCPTPQCNPAC